MTERKYLPTIADLIDRLSISLMKSIFIDRETYRAEMKLIMTDIGVAFGEWGDKGGSYDPVRLAYAISVLMLANRYIWENEAIARKSGKGGRLRVTHSVNGVRNRAKNEISKIFGERVDHKIDCLAAELPTECGDWRVFDEISG
jgi:hypothetical protein